MQRAFDPDPERVGQLLDAYRLTLRRFEAAAGGIENVTLLVDCAEGRFVLRIYRRREKTEAHIRQELAFVQYLQRRGIAVPRVIPNREGDLLTTLSIDGTTWRLLLMERVAGHHADTYSPALLGAMARTQAQLHLASGGFDDPYPTVALQELRETQFIHRIDRSALPDPRLTAFLDRAAQYHVVLDEALPRGLCHLDYDKENILATEDGRIAAVLDFDDLALAPYVVDLAYTAWHVRFYSGEASVRDYLSTYEALRSLTDLERSWLRPIMLFRHYVICSLGILDGEADDQQAVKYLALEESLIRAV